MRRVGSGRPSARTERPTPRPPPPPHRSTRLSVSERALKELQRELTTFKGRGVRFGPTRPGRDHTPPSIRPGRAFAPRRGRGPVGFRPFSRVGANRPRRCAGTFRGAEAGMGGPPMRAKRLLAAVCASAPLVGAASSPAPAVNDPPVPGDNCAPDNSEAFGHPALLHRQPRGANLPFSSNNPGASARGGARVRGPPATPKAGPTRRAWPPFGASLPSFSPRCPGVFVSAAAGNYPFGGKRPDFDKGARDTWPTTGCSIS